MAERESSLGGPTQPLASQASLARQTFLTTAHGKIRAMARCPACSGDLRGWELVCPRCGASVHKDDSAAGDTISRPAHQPAHLALEPAGQLESFEAAGFAPGVIFASRYRILGPLGRGAMGEVYRADDLKLGQRVALKLLSKRRANRSDSVDRFIAEVRLARTISHPNVCRVHDIGEGHGWHYLSMEYVDGETLESLLRRIGRLSGEKALDVARQLCAGLAAAHDRGVLHRDLKPSNIMIDGRGQVRILDLGLALPIGSVSHEIAGTPAYMAPEQLAGGTATERTDVYALGLVLYEIFAGRKLFQARTFEERLRVADPIAIPRTNAPAIDPAVDGTIRRCLERDPDDRPESALDVAAALPGGDALSAAFAAGRLPSPEMVASAGNKGRLSLRIVWLFLLSILGGTVVEGFLVERLTYVRPAFLPKPPEVLAEHAANILAAIGAGSAVDREFWFEPDLAAPAQSNRGVRTIGRSVWYLVHLSSEPSIPRDTELVACRQRDGPPQ